MGLSKKTLCYSISIAVCMMAFILLYFTLMLPSLYVDYMEKDNLKSIEKVQTHYIKERNYNGVSIKNPTGSLTAEIPLKGSKLYLAGINYKATLSVTDPEVRQVLSTYQQAFVQADSISKLSLPELDKKTTAMLKEKLFPSHLFKNADYPFSIDVDMLDIASEITQKNGKTHVVSDDMLIFEGGVKDAGNEYTSYIAFSKTNDAVFISFLPVMTPNIKEIKAIVLGSLPMIAAVVFLLILIASQIFSRKIVNPVIRLSLYAQDMKLAEHMELPFHDIQTHDEIEQLADVLNELYNRLHRQYQELEQENKRQEIFLRASSHQLKTPIAASLLLVDGMIQEVGKYKNTAQYLPVLKKQLLTMRKTVEDILYLKHCKDHLEQERVPIEPLVREVMKHYDIQAEEKGLSICMENASAYTQAYDTDRTLLKNILDNLISNMITYTPVQNQITIRFMINEVQMFNDGSHIDEQLLPHIFEPFVSSDSAQKGRGLGLYIVAYYARVLGISAAIENRDNGVFTRLLFSPENCTASSSEIHSRMIDSNQIQDKSI